MTKIFILKYEGIIKKNSYDHRVYESVDDSSLSQAISQLTDEKKNSCNKGLIVYLNLIQK